MLGCLAAVFCGAAVIFGVFGGLAAFDASDAKIIPIIRAAVFERDHMLANPILTRAQRPLADTAALATFQKQLDDLLIA